MADEKGETSLNQSGSATPKGKLESLSKEDLVKFVKRQTIILQKLKTRNSELESQISGTENENLKEASSKDLTDGAEKQTQISALEHQCDLLKKEKEAVFEKYVTFEKKNKNLVEEIECLNLKNETLTSTFFCLQQEQATLSEHNKKLIAEKSDLQIKLEDMEEESFAWKTEKESLVAELTQSRSTMEEYEHLRVENLDLQSKFAASEKERDEMMTRLASLEFNNEQRQEQVDLLQAEISRLQNYEQDEVNLRQKLKEAEELMQKYEANSDSQSEGNVQNEEKMRLLLDEISDLKNSAQVMQLEFETKQNILQTEVNKFMQETEHLKSSYNDVKCELEKVTSEKCELCERNDEMLNEIGQLKVKLDDLDGVSAQKEEIGEDSNLGTEFKGSASGEVEKLVISENERLLEKIALMEKVVEDERKKGARNLDEKAEEVNRMAEDLEKVNCKLMDYEASMGQEFSLEVIQNLQQELADTKMKLAELEGSGEMYAREDHGTEEEESGSMQQSGWLDLPDIQEESESDHGQQEQILHVDQGRLANGDAHGEPEDFPNNHVCVERIEKFIAVSSHVLAGDSYDRGDDSEVAMLKTRITELEQENKGLRLQFENLSEKNLEKSDEKRDDIETDKHSEVIVSLQAHRQHLEEKLVILADKHETAAFELEELHAERESLKSEMETLQNQLREWERIMGMLKEEKDCLAHEIKEYSDKDASLRKELEFLLTSLNDAITERDSLQDEVFKLSQHEDSAQGDVREMKTMIEGIISERNSLLSELDAVLIAKADATITIEGMRREIQELATEKDYVEREKESLVVRLHLAEDKESCLNEGYESQMKLSSETEERFRSLQDEVEKFKSEIVALRHALDDANEKLKTSEGFAVERKNYTLDLENQVLELSNLLSEAKKSYSDLKEQFDVMKGSLQRGDNQEVSDKQRQENADQLTQEGSDQQIQEIADQQSQENADQQSQKIAHQQTQEKADQQSQEKADPQIQENPDQQTQDLSHQQTWDPSHQQTRDPSHQQSQDPSHLQIENTKYQQFIEQLMFSVNKLKEERDELSHNADLAVQEVENLKKELSVLVNEKSELDQLVIELKTRNENAEESIASLRRNFETLSSDKREIEEKFDLSQKNLLESKRFTLEEELRIKLDASSALEDRVERLELREKELQDALREAEEKLAVVEREKAELVLSKEEVQVSVGMLQDEIKETGEKLAVAEDEKVKLTLSVGELQVSVGMLQDEIKETGKKLAMAEDEKVKLTSSVEDFHTQVGILQNEKSDLERQIGYWSSKVEKLQVQTKEKQAGIEVCRSRINEIESELLSLKESEVSTITPESDVVHILQQRLAEIVNLKAEVNKLSSKVETHEDGTDEKDDSFERIIQTSNKMTKTLMNEKWRCDKLEVVIDDLQRRGLGKVAEGVVLTLTTERDEAVKKLTEEENRAQEFEELLRIQEDNIRDLTTEIETLKLDKENWMIEVEEIKVKLSSAVVEANKMEEQYNVIERKSVEVENTILEKEAEINKYREQINSLSTLADSNGSEAEENLKSKLSLEFTLQETMAEKEALKCKLDEAENVIKLLQENVEFLEIELNKIRNEKDELIVQVNNLRIENNEHVSTRVKSEEEVDELKEKLTKLGEDSDNLSSQINEVTAENIELRLKLEQSEKNVETLKIDLCVACGGRDISVKSLESSVEEIERLQLELTDLTSDKTDLTSKLRSSEEQVENLKIQLSELNESLNNSRSQTEDTETKLTAMEIEMREKVEENKQRNSQENTQELELLRKQLKEKEDITAKLKQLAIKTKKELGDKQTKLDAATKQLSQLAKEKEALEQMNEALRNESEESAGSLSQQLKSLQENYKQVQASFDAVQDEAEQEKKALRTAQKDVEQLVSQLTEVRGQAASQKEEKEQLLKQMDALRAQIKSKESSTEELRTKLRVTDTEMAAVRIQLEELNKDRQKVEQRLLDSDARFKVSEDEHNSQVAKLEASLKAAQEQLNSAWQSAKQNSMLDLEMADYERTISTLHAQVAERDQRIGEVKAEMDKQEQTITLLKVQIDATEEQRGHADERANKLKALLVKAKKDLSDARKLESAQRTTDASLRGKLENTSQQVEEYKVQVSQFMADNQKLQERIRSQSDSSQRTIKSLEARVESLVNELQLTKTELMVVQTDYESYKVRAHNVLKQQKSKPTVDDSTDTDKHEKERYENAIDHLKTKLQEAQEQLQAARKDAEQLQEEHEHLVQRHTKLITDLEEREASFRIRLENIMKEKAEALVELQEKINSLEVQKSFQGQKFQEKVNKLKDENVEVTDVLQKQLDVSEMDNIRLQREIQQLQRLLRTREESVEHTSPSEFYPITVHPVEERQEGEGSEIVDPEPTKTAKAHTQPTAFTFEQLIATPLEDLPGAKSVLPSVDEEALKSNIVASQKKIDHLTELLSESEASVSRLTEQAKILKDEIRRLERNMEREKESHNMEYLKNILLQFVCPKVGEQKMQLVPVLTTMLKLSPEEKARIQAVAQGDDQASQGGQAGVGWGSYLHRWSSLT